MGQHVVGVDDVGALALAGQLRAPGRAPKNSLTRRNAALLARPAAMLRGRLDAEHRDARAACSTAADSRRCWRSRSPGCRGRARARRRCARRCCARGAASCPRTTRNRRSRGTDRSGGTVSVICTSVQPGQKHEVERVARLGSASCSPVSERVGQRRAARARARDRAGVTAARTRTAGDGSRSGCSCRSLPQKAAVPLDRPRAALRPA